MPFYGPSCDNNNYLSCATYTNINTNDNTNNNSYCELTTKETIQDFAKQGGGSLAQNNYCFSFSQECEDMKTYFQCQNKILNIKSTQE